MGIDIFTGFVDNNKNVLQTDLSICFYMMVRALSCYLLMSLHFCWWNFIEHAIILNYVVLWVLWKTWKWSESFRIESLKKFWRRMNKKFSNFCSFSWSLIKSKQFCGTDQPNSFVQNTLLYFLELYIPIEDDTLVKYHAVFVRRVNNCNFSQQTMTSILICYEMLTNF